MINEEYEINDGHYLELLDRLHVAGSEIETHIDRHPLTESLGEESELKKLIGNALSNIAEAYQLVGNMMPEESSDLDDAFKGILNEYTEKVNKAKAVCDAQDFGDVSVQGELEDDNLYMAEVELKTVKRVLDRIQKLK